MKYCFILIAVFLFTIKPVEAKAEYVITPEEVSAGLEQWKIEGFLSTRILEIFQSGKNEIYANKNQQFKKYFLPRGWENYTNFLEDAGINSALSDPEALYWLSAKSSMPSVLIKKQQREGEAFWLYLVAIDMRVYHEYPKVKQKTIQAKIGLQYDFEQEKMMIGPIIYEQTLPTVVKLQGEP